MNVLPRFVLVSAYRADRSLQINNFYTRQLGEQLAARGFTASPVLGSYRGFKEIAWLVLEAEADDVVLLARRYGQTSLLEVDSARQAALCTLSPTGSGFRRLAVGKFRALTDVEAGKAASWTRDKHGQYYGVTDGRLPGYARAARAPLDTLALAA